MMPSLEPLNFLTRPNSLVVSAYLCIIITDFRHNETIFLSIVEIVFYPKSLLKR